MTVSTKVLDYMGSCINAAYYLGYYPYKWDTNKKPKKMEIKALGKHPSVYVHFLQRAMLVLCECFVLVRCIQTFQKKEATVQQKIGVVYKLGGFSILCYFQLGGVFHYGELHHFVNNFIRLAQVFNDKQRKRKSVTPANERSNGYALRTMKILTFVWFVFGVSYLPACVFKPNKPELVTSLSGDPKKLPIWVRLLAGVLHGNITAFAAGGFTVHVIICISYLQATLEMVHELMSPHVRLMDISMRYHQLAVLHTYFNAIFSSWTFCYENCLIFLVTGNLLQTVLFGNIRGLIVSVMLLFGVVYIYWKLGTMFQLTGAMLNSWLKLIGNEMVNTTRNTTMAKAQQKKLKVMWLIKNHKSFRPLKVMIGSFYYADTGLVLTLLGIILNSTISLVFTFRA